MKKLIVFLLGLFLLMGCAPKLLKQREIPPLVFDKTPPYFIDLSNIPKPDKLKPIFMDSEFKEVSKDQAEYIVLIPQEYAKVAAVVKLAKAYKGIVKEQETLINTDIQIINSLKEYVALERAKAEEYRNLWIDSENAYRQERYQHKLDQAITRGTFGTIALGALIALIIAL
jgi:hypothetical protein